MGKEVVKVLKNIESTIERLLNSLSAFSNVNKGEETDNISIIPYITQQKKKNKGI